MKNIKKFFVDFEFSNYVKNAYKSVLAGMCIAIACLCYLSVDDKVVGSLLFSVGLLAILSYDLNLYTGKIGVVSTIYEFLQACETLFWNVIGCLVIISFTYNSPIWAKISPKLEQIIAVKLETSLFDMLILGIICGILMLFATKKKDNYIVSILCVAAFILIGAEHSVADAFYLFTIPDIGVYAVTIFTVAVGNALGAMFANSIIELKIEPEDEEQDNKEDD